MSIETDIARHRTARALAIRLADIAALPTATTALQTFINAGGVVSYISPAQGYRARLHGFTATGTGGAAQAVGNWIAQVMRKTAGVA